MKIVKMKNQKGITLVALVITIIVLVILAGVSLLLAIGENGIISQANSTRYANEKATADEEIKLSIAEAELAYYRAFDEDNLVGRGKFFGDGTFFESACKSAKKKANGKPDVSVTKAAGVSNASNEGEITVQYRGESNTLYIAKFRLENPSIITVTE